MCIALLGMLTVGVSVLSGAAIAASIAVLLPMAAAHGFGAGFTGPLELQTIGGRLASAQRQRGWRSMFGSP